MVHENDDSEKLRTLVEQLASLVRIPNRTGEIEAARANASEIASRFERVGASADLIEVEGSAPYVLAEMRCEDRDAPTLLLYCHYDGVPVEEDGWITDPFDPALFERDGAGALHRRDDDEKPDSSWRMYGRSTADAKAAIVAMLAALESLRRAGSGPAVHLKFLIDGEEERESPSLERFLECHGDRIAADLLVAAEGPVHQSGLPTVDLGVRGLMVVNLTVVTAAADLHSGHFGNWAPNAAVEMARIVASLRREDGTVAVEGFYDEVVPLSDEEKALVSEIPPVEEKLARLFGIGRPEMANRSLQELINLPTLNVRGFVSGAVGSSAGNVIPRRATASIDVRLVAGMDPEVTFARLRNHLTRSGVRLVDGDPDVADLFEHGPALRVEMEAGFPAVRTSLAHPLARAVYDAVRRAVDGGSRVVMEGARGGSEGPPVVVQPTEGGSVQFCRFVERGIPFIGVPTFNFDSNQHTANENVRLDYLLQAQSIFESIFTLRAAAGD